MERYFPSKDDLDYARNKSVPNLVASNLKVLFVGINPGLYSAAVKHHFARPGNRFWPVLHRSGFTPRQLAPFEERELLKYGCGITNVVNRATATAAELTREELIRGGRRLAAIVKRYRPRIVAILGVGAYRSAFNRPKVIVGPQSEMLVFSTVWVLPNPSGLNANYQIRDLTVLFRRLRRASVARAVKSGTEHEELEKSRKNGDRWKLQKHAY
jgi:TDG/mug DNA glycosylase family protein